MISALLTGLVPALLPAVADGIRGVIGRFTGGAGARPQNIDEAVKWSQAEVERLKALAELDAPGENISRWVADLRASARYIAVYLVILNAIVQSMIHADPSVVGPSWQLAQGAFFYLFGDRVYMHIKER